jgi:hypothetical protein
VVSCGDKRIPQQIIKAVQSLCNESNIVINTGIRRTAKIKTNQGLRQGCSLSPTLFNIYIDNVLKKWKPTIYPGIKLQGNIYLNSLLYADDLTIIQTKMTFSTPYSTFLNSAKIITLTSPKIKQK